MENVDQIRAKILGVLVRDARIHAGRSLAETGAALGVSAEMLEQIERGDQIPDMPFLEALSMYLNVSFERFWGDQTLGGYPVGDYGELLSKRRSGIAAQIKSMREEAGKSVEEMAKDAGMDAAYLSQLENGETAVTVFDAEKITNGLSVSVSVLQDKLVDSPLREHEELQKLIKQLRELPEDLRAFIAQPVNQPYLSMAMKLSKMEVNRMRDFAADILEITL
ncbi:MAG: helix-turn-helix transcriptional regulator [Chloroflexota bacterium]